ncbi:MAG: HAD family hydrolase [Lachnospiraceae bacterium]|nr:HAD family hydrolase [Lachnospiraceae bacterium]MDY5497433.1 HAD family hydrolase [Anaerobutyricum sp.]
MLSVANVIAVIWDCDKTLVDGYMQDPIFRKFGVDSRSFWEEVNRIPEEYEKQGIRVNRDTYYLNHFIRCAHNGTFPGLNNAMLREFGKEQKFYKGIPDIFKSTKELLKKDPGYSEYGIQVEHYIISTGFAEVIRGSVLAEYMDGIWGCELIEGPDSNGNDVLSEVVYTIDNTTKTRAIFEINKGIPKLKDIEVNSKIPKEYRRVRFENMIYIADGPSDIPAFSLVHQNGGSTFAIYPKGDMDAMKQVEQMREDGRVDMYAEADYSENTTANMWISNKILEIAERIRKKEKGKITSSASALPRHLT